MGNMRPGFGQYFQFFVIKKNTVGKRHILTYKTHFIHKGQGPHIVCF